MFRQRLLSTDVLPHDSSDSTTSSPIMPHHPRYKHNVAHASIQTSDTMMMTANINSSLEQQQEPELEWLPILLNENGSRLCQIHPSKTLTVLQRSFLPAFLQVNDSDEFYPLLANISYNELSALERRLRQANRFDDKFFDNFLIYSNQKLKSDVQKYLDSYARKWNVHQTILIINLHRLFHLLSQFTLKDYYTRQERQQKPYTLSIEDWFIVLEYYLQMDVTCFFMKTCTFRNSTPRLIPEGLLCIEKPQALYGMKQCRDQNCRFCYERLDLTERFERAVTFSNNQIHRFVNNYQVYLNCDVTCTTSNVIYALTCPCHQYDFVGRCQVPFRDRMWQHRMRGCRLMSNFFIGHTVANRLQHEREPNPFIPDAHIKLYQHSTQCSIALQIFLKCHSSYWCFVPMTKEQILMDDADLTSLQRNLLTQFEDATYNKIEINQHQREMSIVRWCVTHVPIPPSNYAFSLRQKLEQYEFFRGRSDLIPSRFLDLYNAAIVIALPENGAEAIRHIVQGLLVIYAEPKLVITTTMTTTTVTAADVQEVLEFQDTDKYWCQHLTHPRLL